MEIAVGGDAIIAETIENCEECDRVSPAASGDDNASTRRQKCLILNGFLYFRDDVHAAKLQKYLVTPKKDDAQRLVEARVERV
jgi:hypothetical protein